jgi:hypothetical protein
MMVFRPEGIVANVRRNYRFKAIEENRQ